jgi:hypothetical protein
LKRIKGASFFFYFSCPTSSSTLPFSSAQAFFNMSFQETSTKIRLEADNHTLSAECQTSDGQWLDSSIDLNRFLGNNNGQFDTTDVNFATTAQNVGIEFSGDRVLLNASLRTIDEQWNTNQSINLSDYVENHEGTLRFKK